ncbi:hypothetical protein CP533_6849 [Ophiocordyceps camponoti-saundersi (nom. inval.)]|nr:hypothetical protein CP533_6849 [Ophiocordyceps camponoti-saundersi (nom. inval.)]
MTDENSKSFDAESMLEEEKDGLLKSSRYIPTKRTSFPCSYVVLFCFMAVSNCFLVGLLVFQARYGFRIGREQAVPLGGKPHIDSTPSWLPPEEWRTEIFREQRIFGVEPNNGPAKEAWRSLIPKGKGFVMIRNSTSLDDFPGLKHAEKEEQQACIAVFHQLHCLYMTYAAYWDARGGKFEEIPPRHLIHCWDYLRQSIMCAGDTSLEWVSEHQPLPNATTGWGFQHTCKNFDAIYDWAERHRSKESVGIE